MSVALLQAAALGPLRSADLQLSPGRYVVLSNETEALVALIALSAGHELPKAGRVLLDGAAPAASPGTRRQIAALFADEALPPARSVRQSVARALTARGDAAAGAEQLLAAARLAQLADLPATALGPRETRSVALALALAHERASLLCLHEPLATTLDAAMVLAALDRHTARGAIVLTTTSSSADAMSLGGAWLSLELGRVRADARETPRIGAGPWQLVLVESADAARLGSLLHASPLELAVRPGAEARQLEVLGPALDVTVGEVVALARAHDIEITRLAPTVPSVETLLATRAGFARGAYEAARAAAFGGAQPSTALPGGSQ